MGGSNGRARFCISSYDWEHRGMDKSLFSRDDPDEQVWDYSFKDHTGKVMTGRGTLKQMEMHKASRCRQAKATQVV